MNESYEQDLLDKFPDVHYSQPRFGHYFEYGIFRSLSFLFEYSPKICREILLNGLTELARSLLKKRNKICLNKIIEILKVDEQRAKYILKCSYRNFGRNWLALLSGPHHKEISFEGFDYIEQARKEGRGIVIACAHLGLWESIPSILKSKNYPSAIMVAVQHNPLSDAFINGKRSCGAYHKLLHNRLGVRHALSYLKNAGRLLILSDVDVGHHGVFVPFMGKPASTPKWPVELSLRTNALLSVGVNYVTNEGIHVVKICQPHDPQDYINKEKNLALREMSLKMNDDLSREILKVPEQWFWLQRRWKTSYEE